MVAAVVAMGVAAGVVTGAVVATGEGELDDPAAQGEGAPAPP